MRDIFIAPQTERHFLSWHYRVLANGMLFLFEGEYRLAGKPLFPLSNDWAINWLASLLQLHRSGKDEQQTTVPRSA